MIPILVYQIYDFSYIAHFIKGSVHIIERGGSGKMLGVRFFDHT